MIQTVGENQEVKNCERCGQQFGCTADIRCWCMEVHLSDWKKEQISQEYLDCLCPSCLEAIQKGISIVQKGKR